MGDSQVAGYAGKVDADEKDAAIPELQRERSEYKKL